MESASKGDSTLKTAGSVSQSDANDAINNADTTDEVNALAAESHHL